MQLISFLLANIQAITTLLLVVGRRQDWRLLKGDEVSGQLSLVLEPDLHRARGHAQLRCQRASTVSSWERGLLEDLSEPLQLVQVGPLALWLYVHCAVRPTLVGRARSPKRAHRSTGRRADGRTSTYGIRQQLQARQSPGSAVPNSVACTGLLGDG